MKVKVFNSQTLNELQELNLAVAIRTEGECIIGRSPNSGLVLDSQDVSRLHGKFFFENGKYYFCDLGSTNGSLVNGKLAQINQNYILTAGDVVRIGEFILLLEELIAVPEELPATVIGGIDDTVISGWRSTPNDTPEVSNQAAPVLQVPEEIVSPPPVLQVPEEQVPEEIVSPPPVLQVPEEVSEPSVIIEEITFIQVPESADIAGVLDSPIETANEVPEAETTYIEVPEEIAAAAIAQVSNQVPEEVVPESVNTTVEPTPEAEEVTTTQAPEEADNVELTSVLATEAVSKANAPIAQAPEEVSEANAPATQIEAENQTPEVVSQVNSEPSEVSDVIIVQDLTSIEIPESEEVFAVITQAPEETEVVTVPEATVEATEEAELVPQTDEAAASISAVIDPPPEVVSEVPEIISKQYIALMAHDSKKAELAQFVAQHKEFLSQCLTIATPSISETLSQQAGITMSKQTPLVPLGGYQTIASLVGSEDILAVIFLRDFLSTQSSQANEEALLRLCNINQVLFATNVPTAEAIVQYIKNMVAS